MDSALEWMYEKCKNLQGYIVEKKIFVYEAVFKSVDPSPSVFSLHSLSVIQLVLLIIESWNKVLMTYLTG